MTVCEWCGRDMTDAEGCMVEVYDDFVDGRARERVCYGDETHTTLRAQFEAVGLRGGGPSVFRWMLPEGERDRDPTWEEVRAFATPDPDDTCPDCLAPTGSFHHPGCDKEECPRCHAQALSCDCVNDAAERNLPASLGVDRETAMARLSQAHDPDVQADVRAAGDDAEERRN